MKKLSVLFFMACLYPLCNVEGKNIALDISNPPVAADVSFVPVGLSFGTRIDDAILQKIGCQYAIRDPLTSLQLLKLIDIALDVPQDAVDSKEKFEIRNKIVFHFQANEDISLRFSQEFANLPYLRGSLSSEPLNLKKDLVEQVRKVIREAGVVQLNERAPTSCD